MAGRAVFSGKFRKGWRSGESFGGLWPQPLGGESILPLAADLWREVHKSPAKG